MATAKKGGGSGRPPSSSKAKAAEAKREDKTVEFRGVTLTLAPKLPNTFMWDVAESAGNDVAFYQLVQSLLDPEERPLVRGVLAESDGDPDEFLRDLAGAVLDAYGIGPGESSASQES